MDAADLAARCGADVFALGILDDATKSHGKARVDDRRVLSGIIFINRNGLRWCDAPKEYGPHKTLYNRPT